MNTESNLSNRFQAWLKDLGEKQATLLQMKEEQLICEVREANKRLTEQAEYIRATDRYPLIDALVSGYSLQLLKRKHEAAGKRNWVKWVKTQVPNLGQATVYRYISLAERFPDARKVPLTMSMTAVYRLAGILPERGEKFQNKTPEKANAKSTGKKPDGVIKSINSLVTSLSQTIKLHPVEPRNCNALAERVGEVIRQLEEIRKQLAGVPFCPTAAERSKAAETPAPEAALKSQLPTHPRTLTNALEYPLQPKTAIPLGFVKAPSEEHYPKPPPRQ